MIIAARWVLVSLAVSAVIGCAEGSARSEGTKPATAEAPVARGSALERVTDRSHVCMINNHFMGAPQIPVSVNGNTYYGCCPMCKAKLEQDPATRTAIDPVSKRSLDKATAVIGKTKTGAALYFESEQNLLAYAPK